MYDLPALPGLRTPGHSNQGCKVDDLYGSWIFGAYAVSSVILKIFQQEHLWFIQLAYFLNLLTLTSMHRSPIIAHRYQLPLKDKPLIQVLEVGD